MTDTGITIDSGITILAVGSGCDGETCAVLLNQSAVPAQSNQAALPASSTKGAQDEQS